MGIPKGTARANASQNSMSNTPSPIHLSVLPLIVHKWIDILFIRWLGLLIRRSGGPGGLRWVEKYRAKVMARLIIFLIAM